MNIHEQHVAELFEAQEAFNEAFAKINEVYAASVQRSRDKLFAALNGESPRPAVDVAQIEQAIEAPYGKFTLGDSLDDARAVNALIQDVDAKRQQ